MKPLKNNNNKKSQPELMNGLQEFYIQNISVCFSWVTVHKLNQWPDKIFWYFFKIKGQIRCVYTQRWLLFPSISFSLFSKICSMNIYFYTQNMFKNLINNLITSNPLMFYYQFSQPKFWWNRKKNCKILLFTCF